MPEPLVTIVTPSYNQGKFIRHTIDSVLSQSYPNIEYIVMDGGSTDDTLDILKSYGNRIRWFSEKDRGQSHAINKGFQMAKGEIVAWLNSDDMYEPNAVQTAVSFMQAHPDISLVYGKGYIIDENNQKLKEFFYAQPFDLWVLAYYWDFILQPTTFFRREPLERFGYLKEKLNWVMDWDLWLQYGLYEKVGYIEEFLACTREYGETKTSTGGLRRLWEIYKLLRRYGTRKFPPGIGVYAYIHFYDLVKSPKHKEKWQEFISKYLVRLQKRYLTLFPDRWVLDHLYIGIPYGAKKLTLRGELPSNTFVPITLQFYNGDQLLHRQEVDQAGSFTAEVKLPDYSEKNKVNSLLLTIPNAKQPCNLLEGSEDDRPLSFRMEGMEFSK